VQRGEVWWADLPDPIGSEPGFRRPVVIIQSDGFNRSRIRTVIAAALTANLRLQGMPGNVYLPTGLAGLPRPSVINVSQIFTLDRRRLLAQAGGLTAAKLRALDDGLRLVLSL
jgi:mRNA interferase MazF